MCPPSPGHTEKPLHWDLLKVEENTGITLTESYAMYPTAAVSRLYFSHPESRYFGLGKIVSRQNLSNLELPELRDTLAHQVGM